MKKILPSTTIKDTQKPASIESPCTNICVIHPDAKICVGCYRTGDEIGAWRSFSPQERQEIMALLHLRESQLKKRRGGRRKHSSLSAPKGVI